MTNLANMDTALEKLVKFYEELAPGDLTRLSQLYDAHARFKDPFNEVVGIEAIAGIFTHMFATLDDPRFVVTEKIVQGDQCVLIWEFHFRFKGDNPARQQVVKGCSHILYNAAGLVTQHRDYWDAAEELYEKLPLLGSLMRFLKARMRA